jgi:hypothetical protein
MRFRGGLRLGAGDGWNEVGHGTVLQNHAVKKEGTEKATKEGIRIQRGKEFYCSATDVPRYLIRVR